jgi:hypothetical protein
MKFLRQTAQHILLEHKRKGNKKSQLEIEFLE